MVATFKFYYDGDFILQQRCIIVQRKKHCIFCEFSSSLTTIFHNASPILEPLINSDVADATPSLLAVSALEKLKSYRQYFESVFTAEYHLWKKGLISRC
jgi:hypothetical protein